MQNHTPCRYAKMETEIDDATVNNVTMTSIIWPIYLTLFLVLLNRDWKNTGLKQEIAKQSISPKNGRFRDCWPPSS